MFTTAISNIRNNELSSQIADTDITIVVIPKCLWKTNLSQMVIYGKLPVIY